jgi:hypothetical protein
MSNCNSCNVVKIRDTQNTNFRYCPNCESLIVENGKLRIVSKELANKYIVNTLDRLKTVAKKAKPKQSKKPECIPDYVYVNAIIDKFNGKTIENKVRSHLTPKERWALFTDLFSAFPIDTQYPQDYRISFLINYVNKIRNGIKVKFDGTKNNGIYKGLTKSKGYNTQRYDKNYETVKDAFQLAYYNVLLGKFKRLTPMICVLSALKIMSREKKQNKKIDIIGWKKHRGEVFKSYFEARIAEKTENVKSDKFEILKTKLVNFLPSNKGEKRWQQIWELFLVRGYSRKQIRYELNISKAWLSGAMRQIPLEFEEYKTELMNASSKYYRV